MGVSNDLLHKHNVFCVNDLVTIGNDLVGIIIKVNNNTYTIKDTTGLVSTYNREEIRLSTTEEIENNLRQLLTYST